mgnify:CR=1 FL=1
MSSTVMMRKIKDVPSGRLEDLRDDVLERGASERIEPADRKIEDARGADVCRRGVHHVADMKRVDGLSTFPCKTRGVFEVGLLVHADLAGDDGTHAGDSERVRSWRERRGCGWGEANGLWRGVLARSFFVGWRATSWPVP